MPLQQDPRTFMHPRRWLAVLVILVVITPTVSTQAKQTPVGASLRTDVPFVDHLQRSFQVKEGLPSGFIYDAIQTQDGYIWIATHNGVARYDGFQFKVFNRANTPQLPSNDARVLFEDQRGILWIGTTGGLVRFQPGRPGSFEAVGEFLLKSVHGIFEDSHGVLWLGTRDQTWRREGESFVVVEKAPHNVHALAEDVDGKIWLGSRTGVYVQDADSFRRLDHERLPLPTPRDNDVPPAGVNTLLPAQDGGIWIGTNRGLLYFKDGQFRNRGTELGFQRIVDIVLTRSGGLFVAARNGVYRSVNDNPFEKLPVDDHAHCLLEDREGGWWIGHGANLGLRYFRNSLIKRVLPDSTVFCVHEDADHTMWFGTHDGLFRMTVNGKMTRYGKRDGLPDDQVSTIASGNDGLLWIGTRRGFAKWNGTQFSTAGLPPELSQVFVRNAFVDSSDRLWFSLANGTAYCLNHGRVQQINELNHGKVKWFFEQQDGAIWIGHEHGLYESTNDQVVKITNSEFADFRDSHFSCHFCADNGTLWLGTSEGIGRYRSGKYESFTSADGLDADYVDRLVTDSHGNLWCGDRDGCFIVSIKDLDAFAAGKIKRFTSRRCEMIRSIDVSASGPKVCLATDGTMWLAVRQGVIQVAAENTLTNPVPPGVHIEAATLDGESVDARKPFRFSSGRHRLTLDFGATSFSDPNHVKLQYKLDGYDTDWMEADQERTAQYTDLRPGQYTFRVSATNEDGIRSNDDESLGFSVQPRWFETAWFRTLLLFGMIGLIVTSTKLYSHSVQRRNEELQTEIDERCVAEETSREYYHQLSRINRAASMGEMATSIAHEVKQPLFAIVSNAQTAKRLLDRKHPDINEVLEAMGDIVDDGNRAAKIVENVRAMVRKDHGPLMLLDLNQVVDEAVKFIEPEISRRDLTLTTQLEEGLPRVNGNAIELQQVILNLIINGAQAMDQASSECRELKVSTHSRDDYVELAVSDHGAGIDEEVAVRIFEPFFTTKRQGTGMGLAINRTIIKAHSGNIWADSDHQDGTTFSFRLPSLDNAKLNNERGES